MKLEVRHTEDDEKKDGRPCEDVTVLTWVVGTE
jgi:hypothetical protein